MNLVRPAVLSLLSLPLLLHALPRDPAVSRTHIAYVEAGQLWVVPRGGGGAVRKPVRLTDTIGSKSSPRFSPDGTRIAFSSSEAQNEANLYVVPLRGGTPSRVTFLSSFQTLNQWTADDRLLFHTNALSFSSIEMQLFTVSPAGGLPEKLPLEYGADGAIDASGTWLAYTPQWPNPLIANWKRYRGGAAPDLRLLNLRTGESLQVTDWTGGDLRPMWHGLTLYYLSDQGPEQKRNLWSYDMTTRTRRQVTHFRTEDVRSPSIGGDAIVFELGDRLQLLDLRGGADATSVPVVLPRPQLPALHRETDAGRWITHRELAAGGELVLYEARGDLWLASAGADAAAPRNLTGTSGIFEREAALSPDGRSVAFWSDASGEYQLYVRDVAGQSDSPPFTSFTAGFHVRPRWSPDSRRLAFASQGGALFVLDLASRRLAQVDAEPWTEPVELAWSPDSRWLAYTKSAANRFTQIWRYDVTTEERQPLTSPAFNSSTPVFDPSGVYLFFVSHRNFQHPVWDWMQQRAAHRATSVLMAVPLRDTSFDAASFERKAVRLGTPTGAITSLAATHDGNPLYGFSDLGGTRSLHLFDMPAKKDEVIAEATGDLTVSPDGRYMIVDREGKAFVRAIGSTAERPLRASPMTVRIDLQAEWRQIFTDAWRYYRDFFYAPKVKLAGWDEVRTRYESRIAQAFTREEVNAILAEMIGESSVGHAYIGRGGDTSSLPAGTAAMLGADFTLHDGAFRITRIVEGAPWDDTARSPLAGAREGEYLLSVNGAPIDTTRDVRAAFAGLAGKDVTVQIGPRPLVDGDTRQSVIRPIASESDLRRRAWIEQNRQKALQASGGRVGYIHIPAFNMTGLSDFLRQYYGQVAMPALVIDARWSQGGSIGAVINEILLRREVNFVTGRYTAEVWPADVHQGPKAVLVSHMTVSNGENFAYGFRKLGLGPVIGARTWGGLTGLIPVPALIDGGYVNVPNAPFYDENGWLIEGHGLEPDVALGRDPAAPQDEQLLAAVKVMVETLAKHPRQQPKEPGR